MLYYMLVYYAFVDHTLADSFLLLVQTNRVIDSHVVALKLSLLQVRTTIQ